MKKSNKIANALIQRELLPPPVALCEYQVNNNNPTGTTRALLPLVDTFGGRAFLLCLVLTLGMLLGSCQQEDVPSRKDVMHAGMRDLYVESQGLIDTSADSVENYYWKFAGFSGQYPECKSDELYPPTVHNLGSAMTHYGIVQIGDLIINTEWDGEVELQYCPIRK